MNGLRKKQALFSMLSVLLFISCQNKQDKPKHTDTPTSGVISISVDESFQPIIQQEIDVFEGLYQQASIIPYYVDEVEAINMLLRDSVRLAITTRPLTEKEKAALNSQKLFPKEVKIATDAIAIIVNKENKDSLITVDELRNILTGDITLWKQLYPQSRLGDLQLVFDNPNSSTVRYAIDSICEGKPLSTKLNAQKNNESVIDYVSKTPNAMGIIGVSWVSNKKDSTNLSFLDKVNLMRVSRDDKAYTLNSKKPYQAFIALNTYPLTRSIYVIITEPRSGLATGFTTFLASDRGQRIILKTGIVPATQNIRLVNVREEF